MRLGRSTLFTTKYRVRHTRTLSDPFARFCDTFARFSDPFARFSDPFARFSDPFARFSDVRRKPHTTLPGASCIKV